MHDTRPWDGSEQDFDDFGPSTASNKNTALFPQPIFRPPDPGTLMTRFSPQICRDGRRKCANWSNDGFDGAGDSLYPINIGAAMGDCSGELRLLADFTFFCFLHSQTNVLHCV